MNISLELIFVSVHCFDLHLRQRNDCLWRLKTNAKNNQSHFTKVVFLIANRPIAFGAFIYLIQVLIHCKNNSKASFCLPNK